MFEATNKKEAIMMRARSLDKKLSKAVVKIGESLSEEAQERLRCIHLFERLKIRGFSCKEACEAMSINRSTIYRWLKHFKQGGIYALNPRSKRPTSLRKKQWSKELIQEVLFLRHQFPVWGKAKLTILLQKKGLKTSESTIGRILLFLIEGGRCFKAAYHQRKGKHRRATVRWHAKRIKYKLNPKVAGEIIQVDSMSVSKTGFAFKQFTASCPVSKWSIAEVYSNATSLCASLFLKKLICELPFKIQGIQVDGGSEFMKYFEEECAKRDISLYVLPPRSPKMNGNVERTNGLYRREFYEVYDLPCYINGIRQELKQFQQIFNHVRPHQSLAGLTPAENFYANLKKEGSVSNVLN